jgi:hypothetical protein
MRSMARMGCYVLLKSRLVKQFIDIDYYTARDYIIMTIDPSDGIGYSLTCNSWDVIFDSNELKYVASNNYEIIHYNWEDMPLTDKMIELTNYLANCRFDLVYSLMNKI